MEELLVALGQHEAAWDQCRQVSDEKKKNALDESQKILHQVMTSVMASSTSAIGQIDKAFTLNGNRSPRRLVAHFLVNNAVSLWRPPPRCNSASTSPLSLAVHHGRFSTRAEATVGTVVKKVH
jgi:hypothetical protein